MTLLNLYTQAMQSDQQCFEYTGFSLQQFAALLPFFSLTAARATSNEIKLFVICYAQKKNLTGENVGKLLFNANYKRDGNNFITKAASALIIAKSRAFPAITPPNPESRRIPEIKLEEVKSEVKPQVKSKKRSEAPQFLGLPETQSEYLITHAPLNSSGDIYHILAYLILCAHFEKRIPQVMLTYDVATTEKQAYRAFNFAKSLSFNSFFRTEQIESNNAYHEVVRQSQLEKHLKKNYPTQNYVDQMATTTLIAKLYLQHGFATIAQILQRGFSKYDEQYFPNEAQQQVRQYVKDNLSQLQYHEDNKPIVVLHIRHAKSANNHLNIPDNLVVKLIAFLHEKGYDTWCVLADDRKQNLPNYFSSYTSRPFQRPVEVNGKDFSKFQHLQLMTAMAKNQLIRGVIGNTSGTLDACAFVGNRVFNIHQFNETLSYQDLRLTMQLTFLSAEDLRHTDLSREIPAKQSIKEALPNFINWLIKNKEQTPSIEYAKYSIPITKSGFKKMYHIFSGKNAQPLPDIENFCELITGTINGEEKSLVHQGKSFSI